MLVGDIVQSKVLTIAPGDPLAEAMRLVGQRGIRHLPVVEGGKLVGIVSDRDLKGATTSPAISLARHELGDRVKTLTVEEIMTRAVITIGPSFPVEDAARLMVTEKISALPVTEAGRLVGIVTETDVLNLFVRALGAAEPSSRLDVTLDKRPSALVEVVEAVERAGASISSIVTLRNRSGLREAIVRIATINPAPAVAALAAAGYTVRDGYRQPTRS